MKITGLAWMVAALSIASPAAENDRSFHVYPAVFSDLTAVETMARAVVSEGGQVTVDQKNQRLLVLATAREHEKLAELFQVAAVPPRNVQIEIRVVSTGEASESGASVGASGGVVVTERGAKGGVALRPKIYSREERTANQSRQRLLVASGRAATLRVGTAVPWAEWICTHARRSGWIQMDIRWEEVGAFLSVEPVVIGEGPQAVIRVRVVPELSGMLDGQPRQIRFIQAATEVTARPGETVRLGSLGQDQEFHRRFLAGFDRGGMKESVDILLTPTLPETGGAPSAPPGPAPRGIK